MYTKKMIEIYLFTSNYYKISIVSYPLDNKNIMAVLTKF